jgi:hypothetical protein
MAETSKTDGEGDVREDLQQVQDVIAAANKNAASAVQRAARLGTTPHPVMDLGNAHDALLDTLQSTRRALNRVEQTMDDRNEDYGTPTPRQIKSEHADRLKEDYEGPVLNLALMLVERNRREWLHEKPETNGAEQVRRHGLTQNQRTWLNDLRDGWREYDGE